MSPQALFGTLTSQNLVLLQNHRHAGQLSQATHSLSKISGCTCSTEKHLLIHQRREFSSQRVKCEHAHAGIKRYRAVTDVYRNRMPDFDDRLMLNTTGLWNFYLDAA